jgi:hypothetical protein
MNASGGFEPPDPNAAVGPTEVISVVNTAMDVKLKDGTPVFNIDLFSFFQNLKNPPLPSDAISDPKILYDQYAHNFVFVVLDIDFTNSQSHFLIGVSTSDTPTDASAAPPLPVPMTTPSWNIYSISNLTTAGFSGPNWLDYPGFALDSKALYITGNMFGFDNSGPNGTRLFIINKTTFSTKEYDPAKQLGLFDANFPSTLQPAHIYGTPPNNVGTWLVTWAGPNSLGVIRVDKPLGTPVFTKQVLATGNIGGGRNVNSSPPPSAPSLDGDTLDTLDGRVLQAVWRNGNLYAVTTVTPPNEAPARSSAYWFRIDTSSLSTLAIADQGFIRGDDLGPFTFTWNPSVAVDAVGNIAFGFSAANASTLYAGAYYTVHFAIDPPGVVQPSGTLMAGQGPYAEGFGGPDRWGDFSGAAIDPVDDKTFWIFNEYSFGDPVDLWSTRYGSFFVPNNAPVLNGSNSLNPILEDEPVATNPGTLVSDLIAGQATDLDNDPIGIAVLAVNNTNGTWQYTLNGTTYQDITGVSISKALLLDGDGVAAVRFLPNPDFTGAASITFRAWDGTDNLTEGSFANTTTNGNPTAYSSAGQLSSITVILINHAPVFTIQNPSVTGLEDDGAVTVLAFAKDIGPGPLVDVDELNQVLTFQVLDTTVTSGNLVFTTAPAIDPVTGNLTYTTAPDTNGTATVTVNLKDDGGTFNGGADTSATQTFTITVLAVNDPPSFTVTSSALTVLEDAGPQTVMGFAANLSRGPASATDEAGQTLTFHVSVSGSLQFAVDPAIDSSGNLTYTTDQDSNGTALVSVYLTDNGLTANGGNDTSATATFTINVTPVNDPPTFTMQSGVSTVLEDAGPQSIINFVSSRSPGPVSATDEAGQVLTLHISVSGSLQFAVDPAIDSSGTLTYTPAANSNGTATVSVYLTDNGGTANGGSDTSLTRTYTITVTPVNDPPSFTITGDPPTILEDAGPQIVPGFAGNFTLGAPNESGQTLTTHLTLLSGNLAFSAAPAFDSMGNLLYTVATDSNGTATFSAFVTDNGGTANGGSDTSAPAMFTITVTAVNDAPSFTLTGDPATVLEDAGPQTVNGIVTNMKPGPATATDETGQALTLHVAVVSTTGGLTFTSAPAIDSSGNLTYQAAPNSNGTATVNVFLTDNGGTAGGGNDTSGTQTFTITVTTVNDAPSFTIPASAPTVLEDAGARTVSGFASNILAGPPDEAGQVLTFHTSVSGNLAFTVAPTLDSTGKLTYTVAPNSNGTATVTVFLTDDAGTANGGNDTSATAMFTINVTAVNDPPSFTIPASAPSVVEDAGARTVNGFASNILAGPSDETGQTLTFQTTVTGTTGDLTFLMPPTLDAAGNLTYQTGHNAYGTATVRVTLQDGGGTANNGNDTSAAQTFTLTVNAVADTPTLTVANTTGLQGELVPLPIQAGLSDDAEVLSVKLTGVPASATLSAGTNQGNGVYTFTPAQLANLTITDADPGTFAMTVTATSTEPSNGTSASRSAPLVFTNLDAPPVVHIGGGSLFDPGVDYTLQLSASDAGSLTVHQWTINWGDGTVQTVLGNPRTVQHTFPVVERTFTISATATDNTGTYATNTVGATARLATASERYVARAHLDLFGTSIDQTHLWFYSGALNLGTLTRINVIANMLQSDPAGYQTKVVHDLYLRLVGRLPTGNELSRGVGLLNGSIPAGRRNTRLAALEAAILGSPSALRSLNTRSGQQMMLNQLFQLYTGQNPSRSFFRSVGRRLALEQVLIGIFASDAYFAKASL